MKSNWFALFFLLCLFCATPGAPEPRSNRYALVIGIIGYPNFPAGDRLKYSDSDARMFASFLESDASGGFPPKNIHVLLNEKATRANIYREIEMIGASANSDDTVYVYFAGHGVVDNSSRAFFMPYDADPSVPNAAGLRADQFMQDLHDKISAKRLVFFLDACHAGAAYSPNGVTTRGTGNIVPALRALWQAQLPPDGELNMAFLSTASNEVSLEDDSYQHGVFTYYLVHGLDGDADGNHDGKVSAQELRDYISERVIDYARKRSEKQNPTVSPAFDPKLVLSIYSVPVAPITVTIPCPTRSSTAKTNPGTWYTSTQRMV